MYVPERLITDIVHMYRIYFNKGFVYFFLFFFLCCFFFFQAEDGIRDVAVTGVQTCALPIYPIGPC